MEPIRLCRRYGESETLLAMEWDQHDCICLTKEGVFTFRSGDYISKPLRDVSSSPWRMSERCASLFIKEVAYRYWYCSLCGLSNEACINEVLRQGPTDADLPRGGWNPYHAQLNERNQ